MTVSASNPDGADPRGPLRAPTRLALDAGPRVELKAGGPTKADLYALEIDGGAVVVKDFAQKAGWVRFIGRLQIARECRAYRWLGEIPGVTGFRGRIDAHALALARIDGTLLSRAPRRPGDGPELLERLRRVVERIHATGLVHLDLRGHENALLGTDGQVYLLDFASALWMRPGGMAYRCLFRRLAAADEAALLKWKRLLDAGPYTESEQRFLERYRFWRSLWIFNRKPGRQRTW